METKHTPGPWEINSDPVNCGPYKILVFDPATQGRVALLYKSNKDIYPSKQMALANAKLISAAPEMLNALREAVMHISFNVPLNEPEPRIVRVINEAIKKATE